MTIRLIHASGRYTEQNLEHFRSFIEVGDRVITFDHGFVDHGTMASADDVAALALGTFGGTDIAPALEHADKVAPNDPIYCYTDGHFADGYGYDSKAIQRSVHFNAGRFKLVIVESGSGMPLPKGTSDTAPV